jgi:hypothetical protein
MARRSRIETSNLAIVSAMGTHIHRQSEYMFVKELVARHDWAGSSRRLASLLSFARLLVVQRAENTGKATQIGLLFYYISSSAYEGVAK